MKPSTPPNASSERSRLRLVVVRVLVFSLFATLFARLYYLQVVSGDAYHAAAASQSLREVVVQPQRGLIVDDQGRPLVANRDGVGGLGRPHPARPALGPRPRGRAQPRGDRGGHPPAEGQGRPGHLRRPRQRPRPLLERLAVPAGAGRARRTPVRGAADPRAAGGLPRRRRAAAEPARLPQPVRREPRRHRRLPQPDHRRASWPTPASSTTPRSTPPAPWVGPVSSRSTTATCAVSPATSGSPSTRWVACSATTARRPGRPGDTLVTSIDAKVQATTERALADAIRTARATYDPVTHRNYRADSGAAIVLQARTGRVVAMASQPTYDPSVWVGGISSKQLAGLYSKKSGDPLLARALQGQFAPGSTWKPFMTVGALNNGFTPDTRLDCSSGFQVGNRLFHNYESESLGMIDFAKALQYSCDTFFYRVGYHFWQKYGSDPTNVDARDPLVDEAKAFGFGRPTGIDLPGRGRRPDRRPALEARVLEVDEVLLLRHRPAPPGRGQRLPQAVRPRVLPRGQLLPGRRRGELRDRPGRHAGHPAPAGPGVRRPVQRRHALRAADRQGDRQPRRPRHQADRAEGAGPREGPGARHRLRQQRAAGHRQGRHHGLEDGRLPARPDPHPLQDRLGGGLRQAVDLVGRLLRQELRRGDDGEPGRHRVGDLRAVRPQDLGVAVRRPRHAGGHPTR